MLGGGILAEEEGGMGMEGPVRHFPKFQSHLRDHDYGPQREDMGDQELCMNQIMSQSMPGNVVEAVVITSGVLREQDGA